MRKQGVLDSHGPCVMQVGMLHAAHAWLALLPPDPYASLAPAVGPQTARTRCCRA